MIRSLLSFSGYPARFEVPARRMTRTHPLLPPLFSEGKRKEVGASDYFLGAILGFGSDRGFDPKLFSIVAWYSMGIGGGSGGRCGLPDTCDEAGVGGS
jgi:hypothetical protein